MPAGVPLASAPRWQGGQKRLQGVLAVLASLRLLLSAHARVEEPRRTAPGARRPEAATSGPDRGEGLLRHERRGHGRCGLRGHACHNLGEGAERADGGLIVLVLCPLVFVIKWGRRALGLRFLTTLEWHLPWFEKNDPVLASRRQRERHGGGSGGSRRLPPLHRWLTLAASALRGGLAMKHRNDALPVRPAQAAEAGQAARERGDAMQLKKCCT
mmetsp:Transcript_74580/g.196582  ORF Transcript_74580/g.196582 Transcript_74580/m.196582 type:complete len:214 (-) Transcript_74580:7-648(-)